MSIHDQLNPKPLLEPLPKMNASVVLSIVVGVLLACFVQFLLDSNAAQSLPPALDPFVEASAGRA